MKTKILALAIVAIFLVSALGAYSFPTSNASESGYISDQEVEPLDGTPKLENIMFVPGAQPDTGNTWYVWASDDYLGGFYNQSFECVLQSAYCNIWIGLNDTVWTGGFTDEYVDNPGFDDDEWYFAYPWSYMGYPGTRMRPNYRDVIYGNQLVQVANEFDNKIHQNCTSFFGGYSYRPGPMADGKIQILIFNIRDEFFYSPTTAPGFIMGYYWYFISNLNNANIIHIDTWQWWRRQGPNPPGVAPYVSPPYPASALLPYQYEATIAHEFQHLIHRDNDNNEYSWVNEGCSTLAEYVSGYGVTTNLYYYIRYFWDTSLVVWEGNLQNYGVVFLWAVYMYEHYGGQQLIWDIVHEQANGIQGWNNVLQAHGIGKTFDEIFQDWTIANYLDDTSIAGGIYGYYGFDIPCKASNWWDIPYAIYYWGTYDETYPTGWLLPERLPYIAWYWELYNGAPELKLYFNGDDFAGVFPYSPMHEWYSDGTAYSWFRLGQTFAIPATGATLKFWSNYDIEEDWDYGYVEVHDLATDKWYTLSGLNTISTIPNPQDNPNCPDDFEPTAYLAAGRWNAFTGNSGGWYQEEMNLAAYAGHTIELYFTYWTDPYTLGLGWYLDDISISEIGFFDNVEGGADGWTANAGWQITTGVVENDFKVNIIEQMNINLKIEEITIYHISPVTIADVTEDGQELIKVVTTKTVYSGPAVLVAASQPGYEHTWYTEFYFLADSQPFFGPQ